MGYKDTLSTLLENKSIFVKMSSILGELEDAESGLSQLKSSLRDAVNEATEALKIKVLKLNPDLDAEVDKKGKLTIKEKDPKPGRRLELVYDTGKKKFTVVGKTEFQKIFRTGYHHRKALTPKGNSDYIQDVAHEVSKYFKTTKNKKMKRSRWESKGLKA